VYTRGHWRLGWHPTSVEEWTGPGVWTDAVVSYIYATNGIRPEQLAKIKRPTQIGDLVILPEFGFNPPRASASDPYKVSRVVHLFRGSWKHQVSKQVSKQ
jgi:alpha 1,6-mannosyltransferase